MQVSASIVIYNENKEILKKVIYSFLNLDLENELIIVDNSPTDYLKEFCESFNGIKYIYSSKNIGFGAAHNLAFNSLIKASDLHIIVNPDVYFDESIKELFIWMKINKDISLSVPKVFYPNSSYQHTVRNIPSLLTFFKRKLNIKTDEFKEDSLLEVTDIPFAHGCFFIFKTDSFKELNGFDERFFMYMEDVDIFIRAKEFGKTVINPKYKIFHEHRKASAINKKLFFFHIVSIIKFFFKYPKYIFKV